MQLPKIASRFNKNCGLESKTKTGSYVVVVSSMKNTIYIRLNDTEGMEIR